VREKKHAGPPHRSSAEEKCSSCLVLFTFPFAQIHVLLRANPPRLPIPFPCRLRLLPLPFASSCSSEKKVRMYVKAQEGQLKRQRDEERQRRSLAGLTGWREARDKITGKSAQSLGKLEATGLSGDPDGDWRACCRPWLDLEKIHAATRPGRRLKLPSSL